ncbi:unnamed protein product [Symbiodinium natans]|uniref:Uncharacterized protein n=1 Tax=Symbiodinium natans TaxID=878477 RepID=A0A812J2T6_9DINO|nr:unnamed protein product [Symbiodinium natans]
MPDFSQHAWKLEPVFTPAVGQMYMLKARTLPPSAIDALGNVCAGTVDVITLHGCSIACAGGAKTFPIKLPEALCDRGLFRAASALQILGGLGEVFAEGLTGVIGAAEAPREGDATAGDGAFGGTECVSRVEVFISHTWSSGRWPKYLSMCYFLNLGIAVKMALATWVLNIVALTMMEERAHLCDRHYLFPVLIEFPILVFFVFFFFGQQISGSCWAPSLWLDKLCIHQTNQSLKAQQVAALPVFVARSARMLVLWDDTYFERLWCNMEMATFAKYAASPEKMEFLPLWLAPWVLSSVLLDLLGVTLVCVWQASSGNEGDVNIVAKLGAAQVGGSSDIRLFLHMFFEVFPSFLCYLPVALPTMLSFKRKIQGHRLMLEQMASFDLKNAKCSVEADRPLVEEQVALHFQAERDHEVIVAGAMEPASDHVEAEDSRNYVNNGRNFMNDGRIYPCTLAAQFPGGLP